MGTPSASGHSAFLPGMAAADLFLITEKDRRARLPSRNSKVLLLFYTARGYSADDILGQNQIDNDDREDGECNHRIDLPHIKLQPIRGTKLRDQDGKRLLVVAGKNQ